jgi:cobalt-zinc-cadmium efflux system outer membrane protein
MPFPIFDRNQGSRDAARSDVRRGAFERRAAEVQLKSQITAAYQELLSRYGEVSELRSTILPSAREAFDGVRRGFQQGLFRNLDVLDAQRRLFELRLREIDALRAYHEARARVEQLAGTASAVPSSRGANP